MRFGRQTSKFSEKVSNDSPSRRSFGGRSFHRRGLATEKLLSPSLLCVRSSTHALVLNRTYHGRTTIMNTWPCVLPGYTTVES